VTLTQSKYIRSQTSLLDKAPGEERHALESKQAMTALQKARTVPHGRLSSGSTEPDVQAPIMSRLTTATPGAPPRQPRGIVVTC